MRFEDFELYFSTYENESHGVGATEDLILDAEKMLGLNISGSYRLFLQKYGWCAAGPYYVYGLGPDVPKYLDLTSITLSERHEMHPNICHALVPVMNDGGGNLYCLDTRVIEDGENLIVLWDHTLGSHQTPDVVGKSFIDWFYIKLKESANL